MDNDFLPEPSKEAVRVVTVIIALCVILFIGAFIYFVNELVVVGVEIVDTVTEEAVDHMKKTTERLEKLQRQLERLPEFPDY